MRKQNRPARSRYRVFAGLSPGYRWPGRKRGASKGDRHPSTIISPFLQDGRVYVRQLCR